MLTNEQLEFSIFKRRLYYIESLLSDIEDNDELFNENYDISESVSVIFEGTTNKEMLNNVKSGISDSKKNFNKGKEYFESGDINSANKYFKIAINKMNEVESYCRHINDFETSSKIIGNIFGTIIQLGWYIIGSAINFIILSIRLNKSDKKYNKRMGEVVKKYESEIKNIENSPKSIINSLNQLIELSRQYSSFNSASDVVHTQHAIDNDNAFMAAHYATIALSIGNIIKVIKDNKTIALSGKIPAGKNDLQNRLVLMIIKIKKNMEEQITIMNNHFK